MIKYLDMENSSIELELKTFEEYSKFLEINYSIIIELNIKRLTLKVEEIYLNKIISLISELYNNESLIIILLVNLTMKPIIVIPENVIIFNINNNVVIIDKKIYQVIWLKKTNIKKISDLINNNINVVVNPIINSKKIIEFIRNINNLLSKVQEKDVNLGGYLIPSSLMREHPCNAYLCNGWKCHKAISTLPKVLSITSDYEIYPHGLINNNLKIGNIKNTNIKIILMNYLNSKNHQKFIEYCKKVFIKYLANYPYELLPIIDYIKLEMENDE